MMKTNILIILSAMLILSAFTNKQLPQKVTIVAATNLKTAMDSIISVFKIQNPNSDVQIIYGASGKLFEQISNEAPFDIFFSADMEYPKKLKEKNLVLSDVKVYAIGQLAIWSKKIDPNKQQINSLLDANIHKISIGNPATAPYGEKAVESMKFYKIYDKVESKLVFGENINQAAQFITIGAADIGIVALSLALSPNMLKENGHYFVIPEKSHKPLEQGCLILKHAQGNMTATKFFDFVSSTKALDIFKYFGYSQKNK